VTKNYICFCSCAFNFLCFFLVVTVTASMLSDTCSQFSHVANIGQQWLNCKPTVTSHCKCCRGQLPHVPSTRPLSMFQLTGRTLQKFLSASVNTQLNASWLLVWLRGNMLCQLTSCVVSADEWAGVIHSLCLFYDCQHKITCWPVCVEHTAMPHLRNSRLCYF